MRSQSFPANLSNFDGLMAFARENIHQTGISSNEGKKLELAIEEAAVNIMKYAYDVSTGQIEVSIDHEIGTGQICVILKDTGKEFNPIKEEMGAPKGQIDTIKEGGLGLFYIKNLVDSSFYEYKDDTNILTFYKIID